MSNRKKKDIWKGRFREPLDADALEFSSSLKIDQRLFREDIEGSIAHVAMLAKQNILSRTDAKKIQSALREILAEIEQGKFAPGKPGKAMERFVAEDIHMAIEHRLIEKIGNIGGKLHTARSRNDQIALDERLYLKRTIASIQKNLRQLQRVLVSKADEYRDVIMPGYTHMQQAQPVLLAHHLLAYVSMLDRDRERFQDCLARVNRSPLGAGALAGTSFPIDRQYTADALGFSGVILSSMDAVSDRDVQIEFLSSCAITMMHLSRLSEELVLWSSQEWNFAEIGESFTTGSSIMPQKKNPDMAELVRGKTGRVYGDLIALLTVMKGLPLAYNRDMQEDKEPLFDAADTLASCLKISAGMVKTIAFNEKRFEQELQSGFTAATDLAEYLVRKGVSFREAHSIVGAIVQYCSQQQRSLIGLTLKEYKKFSTHFDEDVFRIVDPVESLKLKTSSGSTAPKEVRKAIQLWKKKLKV